MKMIIYDVKHIAHCLERDINITKYIIITPLHLVFSHRHTETDMLTCSHSHLTVHHNEHVHHERKSKIVVSFQ